MPIIISDAWKIIKYLFSKFVSAVLAVVLALILWWPFSQKSADIVGVTELLRYRWIVGVLFLIFAVASLLQQAILCLKCLICALRFIRRRHMYKGKDAVKRIRSLSEKAKKEVRTKYERPYAHFKFSKTDPLLLELLHCHVVQAGKFSDDKGYFTCELSQWVVNCLDSNPALVGSLPEPDEDLTF